MEWFHFVQLFTSAVDEVCKAEAKLRNAIRWAVLKAAEGGWLTEKQRQALIELETGGFAPAWRTRNAALHQKAHF